MHQDVTWYGGRPQPRRLYVRWGPSFPSPKGYIPRNFRPMSVVAKRLDGVRWRTWYGCRPRPRRLCVRWGPSYPQNRRNTHHHPVYGPCLLWPNGWMDVDAAWYGSRPRPRPHCIRRGPALRETGTAAPILSVRVYGGHGRPSQLLLSSCFK